MRASELIESPVVDESGRTVGIVRDLRVVIGGPASRGGFPIAGLVVSDKGPRAAAAHAWGFAQGRAEGPALLRRLLAPALDRSIFVAADRVLDWGPDRLRIGAERGAPGATSAPAGCFRDGEQGKGKG
jgi:hypothetical protein